MLFSEKERLENQERLWGTTITHQGVAIAGDQASGELPSNRTWYVIGCDDVEFGHLARVLGHVERATVQTDGRTVSAAFTDRVAATTAARVGAAFGNDEIWELDRDARGRYGQADSRRRGAAGALSEATGSPAQALE